MHDEIPKTSDRSPRLLSVQVSQTPGLYAGPGVYPGPPGPGLYHNMSSLWLKKSSTFMFTGYQYFVYFHTKTSHIEQSQKRATKFIRPISLLRNILIRIAWYNYLPTLKYRRLRWDTTEVFKIVKQIYDTTILKLEFGMYPQSMPTEWTHARTLRRWQSVRLDLWRLVLRGL